jgi:hypothetical protein
MTGIPVHHYSVQKADNCPTATQNVALNLKNREAAIKTAAYGPLNPKEPNDEFWKKKAARWEVSTAEAKKSRCGNCAFFIQTKPMLECIKEGLTAGDNNQEDAWGSIAAGDLGYCEAFDFKCAASRTCDAWVVGGPVTKAVVIKANVKVGDMVAWASSKGKVERIIRTGVLNVPDTNFSIQATEEEPAVLIRIYRNGEETKTLVGHKASTLRIIS